MHSQYHRGALDGRRLGLLTLVFIALMPAASGSAARSGFFPYSARRTIDTTPAVSESMWLDIRGPSPFDRIGLHRLATGLHPHPVVLYLPGTNMNGTLPLQNPRYWLPLYLAVNGVDIWALDYRTHFIPPATPPNKLAELRRWTDGLFESDINAAVDFIRASTGQSRIFIAGFSRGATFAYRYAANHPDKVRGLMILDGFILEREKPGPGKTPSSGAYATDVGGRHLTFDKRKALLEMVIHDPDGPAPIASYRTARENLEHVVNDSPAFGGHGGLANPIGGYSDAVTLARVLITYDRYWPTVQDQENPLTPAMSRRLTSTDIPVIAFSSSNIAPDWPAKVIGSASSTGTTPTVVVLRGWGHLDVLCGTSAEEHVYVPALEWLRRHAAEAGRAEGEAPSAESSAAGSPPGPTSRSIGR
jgi:pimeloyl-ACP methyl ester carboxylesterase